jgi:hypothetical protein
MRIVRAVAAVSALALLAGCYHQVVDTGLPRASTTVTKPFHPTFIFGLVKAAPIDVRQQCPNGIAVAGTRITFVNGLVGVITFGLVTPHEVSITCASGGRADAGAATRVLAGDLNRAAFDAALESIARDAAQSGRTILVTFAPDAAPTR